MTKFQKPGGAAPGSEMDENVSGFNKRKMITDRKDTQHRVHSVESGTSSQGSELREES